MKDEKSPLAVAAKEIESDLSPHELVELGRLVGGAQVSGYLARQCSFAEAQMLKKLKDSGAYKQFGDWETFCPQRLGISRNTADRIIKNLEAFGEEFFAVAQFTRLSPETYAQLQITDGNLVIGNEEVPIVKANEGVIKAHIIQMQQQLTREKESHGNTRGVLKKAQAEKAAAEQKAAKAQEALAAYENPMTSWPKADGDDHARLLQMQASLDLICSQLRGFAQREVSPENQTRVVAFCKYAWAAIHQAGDVACAEYGVGLNAPASGEWLDVDVATQGRCDLLQEYIGEHIDTSTR